MKENKIKKGGHKFNKKIILVFLFFVILFYVILQLIPTAGFSGNSKFVKAQNGVPLVIAHGGSKHLFPENTAMAFEESYNMGVDVLETDLCITKDGVLITHHNLTIDATSNDSGAVKDFTLEQIKQLNFGYNFVDINGNTPYKNEQSTEVLSRLVPMTVEEMFLQFGSDTLYVMEIKDSGEDGIKAAIELNRLINKFSLQQHVCVASFNSEVMEHFTEIKHKDVNISADYDTSTKFIVSNFLGLEAFFNFEHAGLQLPTSMKSINLDNNIILKMINNNNMFLHYWTINDKDEMEKLILLGCDGIITDRPDLMFEVLQQLGY